MYYNSGNWIIFTHISYGQWGSRWGLEDKEYLKSIEQNFVFKECIFDV